MSSYSRWFNRSFESVFLANRLRGRSFSGSAMNRGAPTERDGGQAALPVRRRLRADAIRSTLYAPLRWAIQLARRVVRPGRRVRLPGRVIV